MDYMTLKEAGEKWAVSARMINYYCARGRIPRCDKNGKGLAYSKGRKKAGGRAEKAVSVIR